MKKILILISVLVLLVVGYFVFINKDSNSDTQSVTYNSDVFTYASADEKFTVQFSEDTDKAKLVYNDTEYELERAVSASGAKYENDDGSVIFWEHQGEGIFEVNGEAVLTPTAKLVCNETDQDCNDSNDQKLETENSAFIKLDDVKGESNRKGDDDSDEDGLADADETERVIMEEGVKNELVDKGWMWIGTYNSDGGVEEPEQPSDFVLRFNGDGQFSATTDCNNLMGNYELDNGVIKFSQIASTKKACLSDTKEIEFTNMLSKVSKATIEDKTLKLHLSDGVMNFKLEGDEDKVESQ